MHSPTLIIMAAILMAIVTSVFTAMWHFNRRLPGLGSWALAYLAGFVFCLVVLSRGTLSEVGFVLLSQTLLFIVAYMSFAAARAYLGCAPHPYRHALLAFAAMLGASLYFTIWQNNPGARFAISSFTTGTLFILSARTLATGALQRYPARYLFALASAAHGLFLFARPLLFNPGRTGLFDAGHTLAVSQFVVLESIVAVVLMAFGALMLANEHTTTELRRLAQRDSLTDVFNRRHFLSLLDKALSKSLRNAQPVAVLLVDLDHFKIINDTLGHKGGDDALRHFVAVASATLRNEDLIGRLGGEEFAILLAGTRLSDAMATAERVRAALAAQPLKADERMVTLTASIGVALSRRGEAPESIIDRADKAMYNAKRNGRDRVETLDNEAPSTILACAA